MIDVYYTLQPPRMEEQPSDRQPASRLISYKGVAVYARPYDAKRWQITALCQHQSGSFFAGRFTAWRFYSAVLVEETVWSVTGKGIQDMFLK